MTGQSSGGIEIHASPETITKNTDDQSTFLEKL